MTQAAHCRFDDITVDLTRRRVVRGKNKVISLSALSFDTLRALIAAAPAPLTADQLIQQAWQGSVVSDDTVTQRIRLLRKALGDDSSRPRYIETMRNAGYRLIPQVEAVVERRGPKLLPWVVAALLVFTSGATVWFLKTDDVSPPAIPDTSGIPLGSVTASELAVEAGNLVGQRNKDSLGHAIKLYEQALEMEPGNPEIGAALSIALTTAVAWYGDTHDVAMRAEQLALDAMVEGAFFRGELALAFSLDSQGKTEPAQAAYERAVALDPEHWGARASLAYLLQVKGKLVEALSNNIIAFEQAPPGTLDVQVASCLRLLGFYSVASEWLDRTDQLDPDSAHAAPTRALDLLTRQEFESARNVIDNALARGVEQVELYEYQAVLALRDDDFKLARAAVDSAPDSISHRSPFAIWRNIIDAMVTGESKAAIESSEALLANIDAGDTWPENFLYIAMLETAANRNDNAIAALRLLEAAGYRDHLYVQLLPPLYALHDDPDFQAIVASMHGDMIDQHKQVLTAPWLPPELRVAENEDVNP
jgi:DNA-binding winged helix-turn-helix (wHTH) protein/thioredoxin-like negative regulator of GroEL